MRFSIDDRRSSYCDAFPEIGQGDINISVIEPQSIMLWHRHKFQADYQLVVKGALKIGVCNLPHPLADDNVDGKANKNHVIHTHEKMYKEWQEKYFEYYLQSISDKDFENMNIINNYEFSNAKNIFHFEKDKPQIEWILMSERNANQGALYIPSGLWHGCYNFTNEQAILIYHITSKWDGTDEERCDMNMMGYPVEKEIK